jgi:hypothetical protein
LFASGSIGAKALEMATVEATLSFSNAMLSVIAKRRPRVIRMEDSRSQR